MDPESIKIGGTCKKSKGTMTMELPDKSELKYWDLLSVSQDPEAKKQMLSCIKDSFKKLGIAIVRVIEERQCYEMIKALWEKVILTEPLLDEFKPVITKAPEYDDVEARKSWLNSVVFPTLPKSATPEQKKLRSQQIKDFKKRFNLMHMEFGACCNPEVFHLPEVWSIRQNMTIYQVFSQVMGTKDLRVSIDRLIHGRMPGTGSGEFLHWDTNPRQRLDESEYDIYMTSVQGKLSFTEDTKFSCVLGTHTRKVYEAVCDLYEIDPKLTKVPIHKDKDPLGFWDKQETWKVPPGYMVIWTNRLLHSHLKRSMDMGAEYGMFLGFFKPSFKREDEYRKRSLAHFRSLAFRTSQEAKLRGLEDYLTTGISETEDRIRSFRKGDLPVLWPSFDVVHYVPANYICYERQLQARIDKLNPEEIPKCPKTGISMLSTRKNGKGDIVSWLLPVRVWPYARPELTELGRCLLVEYRMSNEALLDDEVLSDEVHEHKKPRI